MFYSDFVLSKKGPLARIWLAAHWDKKLTKAQIFETNIESSIERILKPKVKLALRTSGHLMLGVVRIYSRKTKYLLADCNEAFVKIKMAFRPGMVDLPEDHREAAVNAVTLPEVFHDFDSAMPDLNDMDIEAQFTLNQSRADEITMKEDFGNVNPLHTEDGFDLGFDATGADMLPHSSGFDAPGAGIIQHTSGFDTGGNDLLQRHSGFDGSDADFSRRTLQLDQCLQHANSALDESINAIDKSKDRPSLDHIPMDIDLAKDAGLGPVSGGSFFGGGLFEDIAVVDNSSLHLHDTLNVDHAIPSTSKHMPTASPRGQLDGLLAPIRMNDDDSDDDRFIAPSPGGGSSDDSRPPSPIPNIPPSETAMAAENAVIASVLNDRFKMPNEALEQLTAPVDQPLQSEVDVNQEKEVAEQNGANQHAEQTTLLQNEEESFALAPVDASALRGLPKTKRKRKLIVDEVKNISGEEMKAQLGDTSDIVITLDLAPPTKRLMHWKETGGVEKLFALPGKGIPSSSLFKNYQRHLTSKATPTEEGADDRDHEVLKDLNQEGEMNPPPPPTGRRGRKRKQPVIDEEPLPQAPPASTPEVTKKSKMSPLQGETAVENERLPAIAEEPALPSDVPSLAEQMQVDVAHENIPSVAENSAAVPSWAPGTPHQSIPESQQSPFSEMPQTPLPNIQQEQSFLQAQPPMENGLQPMLVPPVTDLPIDAPMSAQNSLLMDQMENMGYDEHDSTNQNQMHNSNLFPFNNDDHDHAPITPGINMGGGITPWHDADYDNPASIGPSEERGIDETVEQFEERILNKRAGHLYSTIRMRITTGANTTFTDLIIANPKKQVAQKFYSLLVLKKHRVLELTQKEAYDTIILTKGPNFDDPQL